MVLNYFLKMRQEIIERHELLQAGHEGSNGSNNIGVLFFLQYINIYMHLPFHGELYCIINQVENDLLQPGGIPTQEFGYIRVDECLIVERFFFSFDIAYIFNLF